jgi:hypothetical protein
MRLTMWSAAVVLLVQLAVPLVTGQVPSPLMIAVPSPMETTTTSTTTTTVAPSPAPVGVPAPFAPAPDGLEEAGDYGIGGGPAPSDSPAPSLGPVIVPPDTTVPPGKVTEVFDAPGPSPAPTESPYSFCKTAVLCYDCSGKALNALDQQAADVRRTDSRCDDVRVHRCFSVALGTLTNFALLCKALFLAVLRVYEPSPTVCCWRGLDPVQRSPFNLNCERFQYDGGACRTTTTTTTRA